MTKEEIKIDIIQASYTIQPDNQAQYKEWVCRMEGTGYQYGYTAGFQQGGEMAMTRMAEYAKSHAIAFGIWLSGNLITEDDTIQDKWWNPAGDSYTTAEVYEKFIEHQNKTA